MQKHVEFTDKLNIRHQDGEKALKKEQTYEANDERKRGKRKKQLKRQMKRKVKKAHHYIIMRRMQPSTHIVKYRFQSVDHSNLVILLGLLPLSLLLQKILCKILPFAFKSIKQDKLTSKRKSITKEQCFENVIICL